MARLRSPWRICLRVVRRLVVLGPLAIPLLGADPIPYAVTLAPTGEAPLNAALNDTSTLIRLRDTAPVGPFALISRARQDRERLQTALGSFGYYDGSVGIRIAGRDLDDPDLPGALEAATGPVDVAIAVTPGPLFTLGPINLDGVSDPAALTIARKALDLSPGDPARAADVLAAQTRMRAALLADGHALAKVATPVATLDPARHRLDVAYAIDAGPRVDLGPVTIAGLQRMNEGFVRRRLMIHQGEVFDPARIEAARQDLASLGVFATVQTRAADALDPAGQIPVIMTVTERKRHVVGATVAYSTDLGGSAGVTWSDRNLLGEAEQLNLAANITGLGGSAVTGVGYNASAVFIKPDLLARDQTLTVSLQAIKENLQAYDRTAALAGAQLSRKLDDQWTVTGGFQAQKSQITQEGVTRDYSLLGLPLGARYDSTGPEGLFEPTHGIRAALNATPTASFHGGTNFAILQASASTYVTLAAPGRSIVALRASIGAIQGATTFQVPPDQRLYAGGSATVRGYRFQSVGPRFPDNRPTGGTAMAAATVEFRQRFGESYGVVAFVDAGQVNASASPFSGTIRVGAGLGARYYTSIGPLRFDVALPLNRQHGDDAFEFYIGIGQVF